MRLTIPDRPPMTLMILVHSTPHLQIFENEGFFIQHKWMIVMVNLVHTVPDDMICTWFVKACSTNIEDSGLTLRTHMVQGEKKKVII